MSAKQPSDANLLGKHVVDLLTGQKKAVDMKPIPAETPSQAARGAHARARKLSPERRSEIPRKAGRARWSK